MNLVTENLGIYMVNHNFVWRWCIITIRLYVLTSVDTNAATLAIVFGWTREPSISRRWRQWSLQISLQRPHPREGTGRQLDVIATWIIAFLKHILSANSSVIFFYYYYQAGISFLHMWISTCTMKWEKLKEGWHFSWIFICFGNYIFSHLYTVFYFFAFLTGPKKSYHSCSSRMRIEERHKRWRQWKWRGGEGERCRFVFLQW